MEDWKTRLVDEYCDLQIKRWKLAAYYMKQSREKIRETDYTVVTTTTTADELLKFQMDSMDDYIWALEQRAKNAGIPLPLYNFKQENK